MRMPFTRKVLMKCWGTVVCRCNRASCREAKYQQQHKVSNMVAHACTHIHTDGGGITVAKYGKQW